MKVPVILTRFREAKRRWPWRIFRKRPKIGCGCEQHMTKTQDFGNAAVYKCDVCGATWLATLLQPVKPGDPYLTFNRKWEKEQP